MDSILEVIGPFGKYQKCIIISLGLIGALCSLNIFSSVFILAEPKFECFDKNGTLLADTCDIWKEMSMNKNISSLYDCRFDKAYYDNTVILINMIMI